MILHEPHELNHVGTAYIDLASAMAIIVRIGEPGGLVQRVSRRSLAKTSARLLRLATTRRTECRQHFPSNNPTLDVLLLATRYAATGEPAPCGRRKISP